MFICITAKTPGFVNEALLERYGIDTENLPVIKLFVWGEDKGTFTDQVTCDNLRRFIRQRAGKISGSYNILDIETKIHSGEYIHVHEYSTMFTQV